MKCIYCLENDVCSMSTTVEEFAHTNPTGLSNDGEVSDDGDHLMCAVGSDEVPCCDTYESNSSCPDCQADFNAGEECTCE